MNPSKQELREAKEYIQSRSGGLPIFRTGNTYVVAWPSFPGPTMLVSGSAEWLVKLARQLKCPHTRDEKGEAASLSAIARHDARAQRVDAEYRHLDKARYQRWRNSNDS